VEQAPIRSLQAHVLSPEGDARVLAYDPAQGVFEMRAVDVEGAVGEVPLGVEVAGFAEDVVGGAVCCLEGLVGAVLGRFCFAHFVG